MKVTFLGASLPLTKTLSPEGKTPYPLVSRFTSYTENITDLPTLHAAIVAHAKQGHCLLKGNITRELTSESRKGSTSTDTPTQWVCLDFDRHETPNIDDELTKLDLGDVSYVIQYSASHMLSENEGTVSAHVFMLLSSPVPAPDLKAWLMACNLRCFKDALVLNRTKCTLSWPLDISTCQNDKLIYIAPPKFEGMVDPMLKRPRIELVAKKHKVVPRDRIDFPNINAVKQQAREVINLRRKAEGLKVKAATTKWVGEYEVLANPDECTVTGVKDCDEYVRLNINGGDSWAYWHAKDNFELIHCFKSGESYPTKKFAPGYYNELVNTQKALTSTPIMDGDLILAFRDLKSAKYYNGIFNPATNHLDIHEARNETQLDHWMRSHGRVIGDFIPVWEMKYLPQENFLVDEDAHVINTFVPTRYMRMVAKKNDAFPTIKNIICHMLGVTPAKDPDGLYEHWVNWFACIFQRQQRPITSIVCHGTQGTGKGYVFNKIIKPLLGDRNVASVLAANIEEDFNGWMEGTLFIFVDEVDVDDFAEKGRLSAKLKNHITEPTVPIRHMRKTAYMAENTKQFMFSSNMPQPVHIPEDDRRYNVGNYQNKKLPRPDDKKVEKELEAFAQFLLAHKADVEKANSIVHTEARDRIQRLGITSLVETCRIVQNGDFESLWMARPDEKLINNSPIHNEHVINAQSYILLLKEIAKSGFDGKLTRDELRIILDYNVGNMPKTPNKFTALLRHNNIETVKIRKNGIPCYGMVVNWKVPADIRAEVEETLNKSKRLKLVNGK